MSLINPVDPHIETGDKVTRRARPTIPRKGAPLRERLALGGKSPVPVPEAAIATLALVQGLQAAMLEQLERLGDTPVLWSGTDQVRPEGITGHHFQVQYKAVHVANLGTHGMTVLAGTANDMANPQQTGPGVFPLGAGKWLTVPVVGNSLVVVGTAGDLARISVYGVALPAAAGAV
jgi:hypothetical protein